MDIGGIYKIKIREDIKLKEKTFYVNVHLYFRTHGKTNFKRIKTKF